MKPDPTSSCRTTAEARGRKRGVPGVKKHGWDWASEEAADAYKLILIESGCYHGSFGGSEYLALFIDLADEVVRLEGRIPDSFEVAVDLGSIYSAAAVSNAGDVKVSDEFIAKANEAWCIASSQLEKGNLKDAALVEPEPLRAAYMGAYSQIQCEVRFARYIQTGCTDVTQLRALKSFWERAKQERPNHPVLQAVGEQINKKLSPAEHTEHLQEQSPAFLPGIGQSGLDPSRQGPQRQRVAAVVIVTIATLTGLAYVYRPIERAWQPQHGVAAGSPRSSSDRRSSVPPEMAVGAPANQPHTTEPSRIKEPETISYAEESAEATSTSQEPIKEHQQNENLSRNITEPQRAATLDKFVGITARNPASTVTSTRQAGSHDVEKAAQFERQGLEALVAGDFKEAQRLFQASENAANGLHYSYEWATLLRTRQAELQTPGGRRAALQFAMSKGYANYAPSDIRGKLRLLAQ